MNVKITETSVTFKISEAELHELATGVPLERTVSIGGTCLDMVIDSDSSTYFDEHESTPLKVILDKKESCLMLCTSKRQIQSLMAMGRSKEGIFAHVDGMDVFLQVDLRSDPRPYSVS